MVLPDPLNAPVTLPGGDIAVVQLNVVKAVELERAIPVVPFEQMACEAGVARTFGVGFTVIWTFTGSPGQPLATGVILYVTVEGSAVVLVSV
jgi:hypothetical protein